MTTPARPIPENKPAQQKITPCLWFNFNAEAAVQFYLDVFKQGRIVRTLHYGDAHPELKGKVLLIEFELFGQRFQALNGGPHFSFTEAISLSVDCENQAEVDRLWDRLTADGGSESECSWLKDKFGLSWQIVPRQLLNMLNDPDRNKATRAMQAMMTMRRIDIAAIERAFHSR
jgi:predicted 3-demethylubiquinone-9 3-methyltransferase (glyoxalase superfamily)